MLCVATMESVWPDGRARTCVRRRSGPFRRRWQSVVLVADKQQVSPRASGMGRDPRDAPKDGPLKIQLEHHTQDPRKAGIHPDRKLQGQYFSALQKVLDPGQRMPVRPGGVLCVGDFWRTKRAMDRRAVVEERQEERRPRRWRTASVVEPSPSLYIPAFDGFELILLSGPTSCPSITDLVDHALRPARNETRPRSYGCAMWSRPRRIQCGHAFWTSTHVKVAHM